MIWTYLKLYYLSMLSHKSRLFLPICFWEDLSWFLSISSYEKINLSIRAQPYHRVSWFSQLCIYTTWGCFHSSFNFLGWLVSERKNLKDLLYVHIYKNWTPPLWLHPNPGGRDFHNFRYTLPDDYAFTHVHFFRLISFRAEDFLKLTLYIPM